jgi:hypothetical protein
VRLIISGILVNSETASHFFQLKLSRIVLQAHALAD